MSDGKFMITTAWVQQADERPWLLSSYCENTEDAWGGVPDFFSDAVNKARDDGHHVRIVDVFVDYRPIEERFDAARVDGRVSGV